MIAVQTKHLTKNLKGHIVLDDVSISLESGKIYGFLGRNGSGKTMLLRAIAGLIIPTSGEVEVFGQKVGVNGSFAHDTGIVIEEGGFWDDSTGFQNLKALANINKKIGDQEIREALNKVGLAPDDKRTFKKYSLGMKKRLALAQAIMEKPKLLLLDEPTNALDLQGVEDLRHFLLEEKNNGMTIVMASHSSEDIKILCDETILIDNGKIIDGERHE
ncbi:ABC transporter ATP-binding protein [Guggenheimella bovis]